MTHTISLKGKHFLSQSFLGRAIKVLVVGAGGTGSHMISDLAVLHQTMLDMGHPHGLDVTILDDDEISEANIGRARFYAADVGLNKALVLVNRVNACLGVRFKAETRRMTAGDRRYGVDVVIGCVDTRESRRTIWEFGTCNSYAYWLDMGNGASDGQVVLGEFPSRRQANPRTRKTPEDRLRLPCVVELFPEMLDAGLDPKDSGPSCSRAEALTKQSAFVNKAAALHGVTLLAELLLTGQIDHHAVFFNVRTGRSTTLACDPAAWERFGHGAKPKRKRPRKDAAAVAPEARPSQVATEKEERHLEVPEPA